MRKKILRGRFTEEQLELEQELRKEYSPANNGRFASTTYTNATTIYTFIRDNHERLIYVESEERRNN